MKFCIYRLRQVNYIGSTVNIKSRIKKHKFSCHNKKSVQYYSQLYKYIRANDLKIKPKIYATYKVNGSKKFNNKMRMLIEQYYIDKYNTINNGLNCVRAFTSAKYKRENTRQWKLNNRDRINKRQRIKVKCEKCGCISNKCNILRHLKTNKCKRIYNNNISNNIYETKEAN